MTHDPTVKSGPKERRFLDALRELFVGAKVDGKSGYINLMRIKASYFQKAVEPALFVDIIKASDGMASRFARRGDLSFPFIDLIWVDDTTFSKMMDDDAQPYPQQRIPVISFRALLAMKLFALKDNDHRDGKDLLDIRSLLRYGHHALPEEEFKSLCERHAGPGAYEKIRSNT